MGLDVADVRFVHDGMVLPLRRSKTDQEGAGEQKAIPYGEGPESCPVRALQAWLEAAAIASGPLFRRVTCWGRAGDQRLSDQVVALVVKQRARAAGLDARANAGHSLGAGLATAAARRRRRTRHHAPDRPPLRAHAAQVHPRGPALLQQRLRPRRAVVLELAQTSRWLDATRRGPQADSPVPDVRLCDNSASVTTKDVLHALVDELDESEAEEVLGYLKARGELSRDVTQAYIDESQAAYDEAFAPDAVRLPHEAVRKWLLAWGTSGEATAERELDELEQRLTNEVHNTAGS